MIIKPQPNCMTFEALRKANILRLPLFKNSKGGFAHSKEDGSDWSRSDWLEAIVGEFGEYANFSKKYRRGDISKQQFLFEAKRELADVATYLDILAMQLNINLGQEVVNKFNFISNRVEANVYLKDGFTCAQCLVLIEGKEPEINVGEHPICSDNCHHEWQKEHE